MRLACPRRRTLLAPEGHGTFAATGSPRCGWRLSLVFLHLLVGDAERIGQVLLAHCKHNAAHAHPAADMLVDGARDLLRSNCIAKRHGSPLAKSYEQKNRPNAGTFDLLIQRAIFGRYDARWRVEPFA